MTERNTFQFVNWDESPHQKLKKLLVLSGVMKWLSDVKEKAVILSLPFHETRLELRRRLKCKSTDRYKSLAVTIMVMVKL